MLYHLHLQRSALTELVPAEGPREGRTERDQAEVWIQIKTRFFPNKVPGIGIQSHPEALSLHFADRQMEAESPCGLGGSHVTRQCSSRNYSPGLLACSAVLFHCTRLLSSTAQWGGFSRQSPGQVILKASDSLAVGYQDSLQGLVASRESQAASLGF